MILKTVFGANCYNLFQSRLGNPLNTDRSPAIRLQEMYNAGIRFVRFAASPFWPNEWQALYINNKVAYWAAMDEVFNAAKSIGMKLVPTLFWSPLGVSDLNHGTLREYTNTSSPTMAFVHNYYKEMLPRYAAGFEDVVICWEFGNEFNINLDLPIDRTWGIDKMSDTARGTPAFSDRTNSDTMSTAEFQQLMLQHVGWTQQQIPNAKCCSGSAWPNMYALQMILGKINFDSQPEHVEAVQISNLHDGHFSSVHLYYDQRAVYSKSISTFDQFIATAKMAATRSGCKMLLGEFGLSFTSDVAADQAAFDEMITSIQTHGVDYAAVWNYDMASGDQSQWNISTTSNSWVLQKIAAANA